MSAGSITVQVAVNRAELDRLIAGCKGAPERIVHDGKEYGIYQEFGTRKMRAHPFMTPAAETVRPAFERGLGDIDNLATMDAYVDKIAHDVEAYAKHFAPVDTGALRASIEVSGD
jgi:hypothetical protein